MKEVMIRLLFLLLLLPLSGESLKNSRPNIVYVLTDDQGMGDLSCMGNPYLKTPHVDAFYKKATRFTDFQVSPTCTPTRAALMSGRYPFEVGVSHTILCRERLALDVVTFPQALQKAGYKNGIFGKWHLGDDGEEYLPGRRGFDEVFIHGAGGLCQEQYGDLTGNDAAKYFNNTLFHNGQVVRTEGFCTDVFFSAALGWMKKQVDADQPYFSYISLNAPHGPMYAPEESKKRFLEMGMDEGSAARYGMVENMDDNFGLLMEKLEEWGQLDKTLVIFMTDNGMSMKPLMINGKKEGAYNAGMRGTKNSTLEGGTRVPSFWYWKGRTQEGQDVKALSAHLDFYKTFCELVGTEVPESKLPPHGRSLIPFLENPSMAAEDRVVFANVGRWKGGQKEGAKYDCSVRTQKWRLVKNKYLYEVNEDLLQKNDVSKEHPEVVKDLSARFEKWWESTQVFLEINAGLKTPKRGDFYLQKLQKQQLKEKGALPLWMPVLK